MKPETPNDTYHGLLGLDTSPGKNKFRNAVICLILVTCVAGIGLNHINGALLPNETPFLYVLIALLSPCCIAAGVLRLLGLKWRVVVLLFMVPPVAVLGILFVYFLLTIRYLPT